MSKTHKRPKKKKKKRRRKISSGVSHFNVNTSLSRDSVRHGNKESNGFPATLPSTVETDPI